MRTYLSIAFVLILTGCGLPVPEELPIITAGVLSSQDKLDPWTALLACLIGAHLGDLAIYSAGYYWGHSLAVRHPRFAKLLHAQDDARLETMIRQHGFKVLFVSRFLVGIRAPIYLAAGTIRMPLRQFIVTDIICAASVVGTVFGLSYFFGERFAATFHQGEVWFTIIAIVAVVVVWLVAGQRLKRFLSDEREENTSPSQSARATLPFMASQNADDSNSTPVG